MRTAVPDPWPRGDLANAQGLRKPDCRAGAERICSWLSKRSDVSYGRNDIGALGTHSRLYGRLSPSVAGTCKQNTFDLMAARSDRPSSALRIKTHQHVNSVGTTHADSRGRLRYPSLLEYTSVGQDWFRMRYRQDLGVPTSDPPGVAFLGMLCTACGRYILSCLGVCGASERRARRGC